ncbi:MAG: hypothetical protein IJM74_08785 [Bacteroidales bacterium]|nr:hypothetical protein [Bacteroidales bacterium]
MAKQTPPFNPDVRPVDFTKVVAWLPNSSQNGITIDKLGRRSQFQCYYHQFANAIAVPYVDRHNQHQEYLIQQQEWGDVCSVIAWAINTGRNPELTYWYNNNPSHPEAPRVPNHLFGPNVPAICRAFYEATLDQ